MPSKRPNGSVRAVANVLVQLVRSGALSLQAVGDMRHTATYDERQRPVPVYSPSERRAAQLALAELTHATTEGT